MTHHDPNSPTYICDDYPLHWQMTRWEKIFLHTFAAQHRFARAIEVGTYKGGSLQVLSKFCGRVCSIDISDEPRKTLETTFENVEFLVGDSKMLLPQTLEKMNRDGNAPGLVLIDGDHSENGVRSDIENVLKSYDGSRELFIVCHDSFNPACRKGMESVDYAANPHVHFAELDFIPGVYHYEAFDTAEARSMWGGLALIHLKPETRQSDFTLRQSQRGAFETIYESSMHAAKE